MGSILSKRSVIAPEPNSDIDVFTGNSCFICLESCERIYETRCECIIHCHESCNRDYERFRMHTCPICRVPYEDINADRFIIPTLRDSMWEHGYKMTFGVFFLCIVLPTILGMVLGAITYFSQSEDVLEYFTFIYNNWFSLWITGVVMMLMGLFVIGCCRAIGGCMCGDG